MSRAVQTGQLYMKRGEPMKQYVIIGNGIAAAGCIEGIRSIDTESHIVVVSKESQPVYCRPLISYYLEGKTTLDKIGYRPDDFYQKMDVRFSTMKPPSKLIMKTKQLCCQKAARFRFLNYALLLVHHLLFHPLMDWIL